MNRNKKNGIAALLLSLSSTGLFANTLFYKGLVVYNNGLSRPLCIEVDDTVVDDFAGDPDMEGHGFEFRAIPKLQLGSDSCTSRIEHNGGYIKSCHNHYLTSESLKETDGAPNKIFGEVFNTLERFGPAVDSSVAPVGHFMLSLSSDSCF